MMDHPVKFMPPSQNSEGIIYFAHSENDEGVRNPLHAHLTGVGNRARNFADIFETGDSAYLAGLLHDLGKYGDLFQRRLNGAAYNHLRWDRTYHCYRTAVLTPGRPFAVRFFVSRRATPCAAEPQPRRTDRPGPFSCPASPQLRLSPTLFAPFLPGLNLYPVALSPALD
jgi:hypothetical protein